MSTLDYDVQETPLTPLETLRHSAAHVLADAVKRLFPHAKLSVGPHTETGFFYDFEVPTPFTEQDLPRIAETMQAIVAENLPFVRKEISREEAIALFTQREEPYKLKILQSIPEGQTITLYQHGSFADLCRGPHVEKTGQVKAFALLSVAGAYFKNDAKNKMLSRIYGTAFLSQQELQTHLEQMEEAKRRDHRKLGKELELLHFDPWAPGAVFWLPKGALLWNTLSQWIRQSLLRNGYVEVRTPMIFNKALWERSGHWAVYREDMFVLQSEEQQFALKPMNCPSHMLLFASRKRSYRELPLRLHDQGILHRNEASGTLGGLTRVRQFSQDDAHLFITQEQIGPEIDQLLRFVDRVYNVFGLSYQIKLSTRNPNKMVGNQVLWDQAETYLREVLVSRQLPYHEEPGEGAFYGPKIDFDVTDAIGRKWQCATIQLDFQLPERFDLSYIGSDGEPHRPVVIHRAVLGSFERFLALLIEHYAGSFPTWLSPIQVKVMGISEKHDAFVQEVEKALIVRGIRVDKDMSEDKLGAKIRRAQLEKVPYMVVIGDREVTDKTVSPRRRTGEQLPTMSLDAFVTHLLDEAYPPMI